MSGSNDETLNAAATELVEFMERHAQGAIFDDDDVWLRFKQAVGESRHPNAHLANLPRPASPRR